jgi:RNA recognition motif-containing protein
MSFTVFLGNLPVWVTADDIKSWLAADNLVADAVKVIRNPETQESKGFAFIEAPNQDEMNTIIRRFDRAPLEDRLLRANPAQPPKGKGQLKAAAPTDRPRRAGVTPTTAPNNNNNPARDRKSGARRQSGSPAGSSAFAEELAKVL